MSTGRSTTWNALGDRIEADGGVPPSAFRRLAFQASPGFFTRQRNLDHPRSGHGPATLPPDEAERRHCRQEQREGWCDR